MASGSCFHPFSLKLSRQSFLFQIVINTFYCQPCQVFFPGCFFFLGAFNSRSSGSVHPGRRRLCFIKEYDSPVYFHETYLFRIRHFFRWISKRFFWKRPSVPSSAASCHLRQYGLTILPSVPASQEKLCISRSYQTYSVVLCVLDRHNQNSCLYTDSDYNRIFVFPPILQIWAFVIMTVDNTSGKPLFYSFSDVLSTTVFLFTR